MKIAQTAELEPESNIIEFSAGYEPVDFNAEGEPPRQKWMMVDDDETILRLMSELLPVVCGAEVVTFSSAEMAAQAFAAQPDEFNMVITDLDMPGMNGVDLCQRLLGVAPELKIVLVTGHQEFTETEALHCGFSALVRKPFSLADLDVFIELSTAVEDSRNLARSGESVHVNQPCYDYFLC